MLDFMVGINRLMVLLLKCLQLSKTKVKMIKRKLIYFSKVTTRKIKNLTAKKLQKNFVSMFDNKHMSLCVYACLNVSNLNHLTKLT